MTDQRGKRIFRSPPWYVAFVAFATLLFAAGAWQTYSTRGLHPVSLGLMVMMVLGVLGVIEVIVDRVILTDDALHVVRIWSRRRYAKSDIVSVTQMKGTPVSLRLSNGRWANLPTVAVHPNTLRAWLRDTREPK